MGDLLSSIGILLVFLTFLLNGLQKEADEALAKVNPPTAQTETVKQFRKELLKIIWLKAVPITLIFGAIFYVLLPRSLAIFKDSTFVIWDFDILTTLFVLIEIGLFGLFLFSLIKLIQLIKKRTTVS